MKRILKFAFLTAVIVLLTACNNVNKPTYSGNINDSSIGYIGENSEITVGSSFDEESFESVSSQNDSYVDKDIQSSDAVSSDEVLKTESMPMSESQSSVDSSRDDGSTSSQTVSSNEANSNVSQKTDSVNTSVSSNVSETVSGITSSHTHQFQGATCTEPKICLICGLKEGEPQHRWKAATCQEPKTCIACNKTEGTLGNHIFIDGECNFCHQKDPNYEFTPLESTNWEAPIVDGSLLYRVVIDFTSSDTPSISYALYENLSETAECDQNLIYNYQGQRYVKVSESKPISITVENKGDTVILKDIKNGKLNLERITEENMVISKKTKKFSGYEKFLIEDIMFVPKISQ